MIRSLATIASDLLAALIFDSLRLLTLWCFVEAFGCCSQCFILVNCLVQFYFSSLSFFNLHHLLQKIRVGAGRHHQVADQLICRDVGDVGLLQENLHPHSHLRVCFSLPLLDSEQSVSSDNFGISLCEISPNHVQPCGNTGCMRKVHLGSEFSGQAVDKGCFLNLNSCILQSRYVEVCLPLLLPDL